MTHTTPLIAFERILEALVDYGSEVLHDTLEGRKAQAQCPAHHDRNPSLTVTGIEGKTLIYCHAGCSQKDVLAALGMTLADLYDEPGKGERYDYTDDFGTVQRTVTRGPDSEGGMKKFRQRVHSKDSVPLYRLPEVTAAVKDGHTVYLVEGEKDVHALEFLGAVATTAPQGSQAAKRVDLTPLHGASVVLVADRDPSGIKWRQVLTQRLHGIAARVDHREANFGKDAADHVAAGGTLESLVAAQAPQAAAGSAESTPARGTSARLTRASEIEPEPVVWAWEDDYGGRQPSGALVIAAGREGTGKSSFGIWQSAQITQGALPGSFHGTPREVFYVAVEDSWKHTLVPRLMAAGADLERVYRFEVITEVGDTITLSLPQDLDLLEASIKEHDAALVVVDPLMSAIGGSIDTHNERQVRQALDPLAQVADRTGAVILGIAHFNKSSSTDAASLITGSGAFKNVPRAVFGFARDENEGDGNRVFSQVKNSLGRDDLPSLKYRMESAEVETRYGPATTGRFRFDGISDRSIEEVLKGPDDARDAKSFIKDYLRAEGGSADAAAVIEAGEAEGFAASTLKNARHKVADSIRSGFPPDQITTWIIRGTASGTHGSCLSISVPEGSVQPLSPWERNLLPESYEEEHSDYSGTQILGYCPPGESIPEAVPEDLIVTNQDLLGE